MSGFIVYIYDLAFLHVHALSKAPYRAWGQCVLSFFLSLFLSSLLLSPSPPLLSLALCPSLSYSLLLTSFVLLCFLGGVGGRVGDGGRAVGPWGSGQVRACVRPLGRERAGHQAGNVQLVYEGAQSVYICVSYQVISSCAPLIGWV